MPLAHPTNRNAADTVLKLFACTPALGVMARRADVQESVGTVKCAAEEVAEPAVTLA